MAGGVRLITGTTAEYVKHADAAAALRRQGKNYSQIARELGVTTIMAVKAVAYAFTGDPRPWDHVKNGGPVVDMKTLGLDSAAAA